MLGKGEVINVESSGVKQKLLFKNTWVQFSFKSKELDCPYHLSKKKNLIPFFFTLNFILKAKLLKTFKKEI